MPTSTSSVRSFLPSFLFVDYQLYLAAALRAIRSLSLSLFLSFSLVLQRTLLRILSNTSFEFEEFLRILTIAILLY